MANQINLNKIYLGDCLAYLVDIPDNFFDCAIIDPPYGTKINKMNFVKSGAVKVGGAYRNDYRDHPTNSDEKGIAILRALINTEKIRYIKYQSTSEKLDVPSSFVFEGSVIILTNHISDEMDSSLMSRAIHRKIIFTLQEKLNFAEKVIKFHFKHLLENEDFEKIMNFVNENVDETTKNFSFRSVIKIVEFYNHNKDKWEQMALEELEKDEELVFIKDIAYLEPIERNVKWYKETGKSIRTLQRRLKEMGYDKTTLNKKCFEEK